MTGEYIVKKMFEVLLEHSKLWDLGAVFLLIFIYMILFLIFIKIRERASSVYQTIYRKKIIFDLKFRRTTFSSRRYQPQYPLPNQEGLNFISFLFTKEVGSKIVDFTYGLCLSLASA